ncbi:uncharacterized protein LOC143450329 [Clavelina lepadiformis]
MRRCKYFRSLLLVVGILICWVSFNKITRYRLSNAYKKHFHSSLVQIPVTNFCKKPEGAHTYKICNYLPYSEVKCGKEQNGNRSSETYRVPNEVMFIWFAKHMPFRFYNYLALRSAASIQQVDKLKFYYSEGLPVGKYWERTVNEIPCLELIQVEEPGEIFGVKMPDAVRRTDLGRINYLIESGGVYVDGDVITLKKFDALRNYPITIGRSTASKTCLCVVFAEKESHFLMEFRKKFPEHFQTDFPSYFTTWYLGEFIKESKIYIHMEDATINRPNPYVSLDGVSSTTEDRIDISNNFFLHIHPNKAKGFDGLPPKCLKMEDDELRILDTVYGEAARIALFGSPDLIFKPGEETYEQKPKRKIKVFSSELKIYKKET